MSWSEVELSTKRAQLYSGTSSRFHSVTIMWSDSIAVASNNSARMMDLSCGHRTGPPEYLIAPDTREVIGLVPPGEIMEMIAPALCSRYA